MSADINVQQSVFTRLTSSVTLMSLVKGVYDKPLQVADSGDNSKFPYINIGEDLIQGWSTADSVGVEATLIFHVWDRSRGYKTVKQIQGELFTLLSRYELVISGYKLITLEFESNKIFVDQDGITNHGVSQYRLFADLA